MNSRIRIIMADDHEVFRDGFAAMFGDHPEFMILDQASNGVQLLSQVERHLPDVVLTDIQMDPVNGIEASRQIYRKFPLMPIIALSMYDDEINIHAMLNAGAVGYLVKNARKETIAEAMKAAFRGQNYYCRAAQKIAAVIASNQSTGGQGTADDFSPTEIRLIRLLCEDRDTAEIAGILGISPKSVRNYRLLCMEKAGVKNLAGLVVYAIRQRLYTL